MMDLKMEVYSPGLELVGYLETFRSVIWEEKAFSSGSFSVDSLITPEALSLLKPENIIWIEGETAGIIEYIQEEAGQNGPYITVKGSTLTGILNRRILWGMYNLKETPPAIMHQLVDDCCVNPTGGDVDARKIPGLVLLDAPAGGDVIRLQKTGGTLLEVLEQLGETYGVAFGVRFNPAVPQMEFWTRWGRNLTVHQSVNPQVFYSTELDDVLQSEYSYNSQNYRNVSLIAGEGEGSDRVYVTVEDDMEETPDVPVNPPAPPEPVKYTVTLLADPEGSGVVSGGNTVVAGTSVTATAEPSDGYEFAGWTENGAMVSTSAAYTFTVTEDRALTAVFAVKKASRLPIGYTELEYISTGYLSCIRCTDINSVSSSNTRIVMDISPNESTAGKNIFADQYGTSGSTVLILTTGFEFINGTINEKTTGSYTFEVGSRTTVDFTARSKTLKLGSKSFSVKNPSNPIIYNNLFCFGRLYGVAASVRTLMMDIYSTKIYNGDTLMCDCVPCSDPTGKIGLYNLVSQTFYPDVYNSCTAGPSI